MLTLASVLAPFAAGTFALLMTLASGFGAGAATRRTGLRSRSSRSSPYLLPESLLRLVVAMGQGRPIGSVLGLPLYLLARLTGLVGRRADAPARPKPPLRNAASRTAT